MVLILLIGDLHIPNRATELPPPLRKLLVPGKIQQILSTGNLCDRETYEYLKLIAPDVRAVCGDFDIPPQNTGRTFPQTEVVAHGGFRIGVIHGHQVIPVGDKDALATVARQLDVDLLVSGHTHQFTKYDYQGRCFVNPGSATGAYSSFNTGETLPSFVLMDVQDNTLVLYLYQLVEDDVSIQRLEVEKGVAG